MHPHPPSRQLAGGPVGGGATSRVRRAGGHLEEVPPPVSGEAGCRCGQQPSQPEAVSSGSEHPRNVAGEGVNESQDAWNRHTPRWPIPESKSAKNLTVYRPLAGVPKT